MKRSIRTLLLCGLVVLFAVGCTKKSDDSISSVTPPGYPKAEGLPSVSLPPGLGGSVDKNAVSNATPSMEKAPSQSLAGLPKARTVSRRHKKGHKHARRRSHGHKH